MREVCVQFQPGRASDAAARLRTAWLAALPPVNVVAGDAGGRYVNLIFQAASCDAAAAFVRRVLDDAEVGPPPARRAS